MTTVTPTAGWPTVPWELAQMIIAYLASAFFMYSRMTFGGSPNPPTWCNFSEMVADLANEISLCLDWDQSKEQSSKPRPTSHTRTKAIGSIDSPCTDQRAVINPAFEAGKAGLFIDNLIDTYPDLPESLARKPHVVPLAMHVTSRPHAGDR